LDGVDFSKRVKLSLASGWRREGKRRRDEETKNARERRECKESTG